MKPKTTTSPLTATLSALISGQLKAKRLNGGLALSHHPGSGRLTLSRIGKRITQNEVSVIIRRLHPLVSFAIMTVPDRCEQVDINGVIHYTRRITWR